MGFLFVLVALDFLLSGNVYAIDIKNLMLHIIG